MGTAARGYLRTTYLKKEKEGFLVAAQSQALGVNAIEAKIVQSQGTSRCSLCHHNNETAEHIVSEWPKIAQT